MEAEREHCPALDRRRYRHSTLEGRSQVSRDQRVADTFALDTDAGRSLHAESIRIARARRTEAETLRDLRKALSDAQIALTEREKYQHASAPTLDRMLMSRLLTLMDKVKADLAARGK